MRPQSPSLHSDTLPLTGHIYSNKAILPNSDSPYKIITESMKCDVPLTVAQLVLSFRSQFHVGLSSCNPIQVGAIHHFETFSSKLKFLQ